MPFNESNYYVTLGLDQDCTDAHIRAAYRLLAKQHHPDVNPVSSEAKARTQALNAAYETLSDPARRQAYDLQLAAQKNSAPRIGSSLRNSSQEVQLRLEEFLRGTTLQVRVIEPAEPNGDEVYELVVPAETAPGTVGGFLSDIGNAVTGQGSMDTGKLIGYGVLGVAAFMVLRGMAE